MAPWSVLIALALVVVVVVVSSVYTVHQLTIGRSLAEAKENQARSQEMLKNAQEIERLSRLILDKTKDSK